MRTPPRTRRKRKPCSERFWAKVRIRKENECWEWTGATASGYGTFYIRAKDDSVEMIGAHRYSLQLKIKRQLQNGEWALHTCDNKRCVNPKHLFVGSAKINTQDMLSKGRNVKGEQVEGAILTADNALKIRNLAAYEGKTSYELAEMFHVTFYTILHVLRGSTWKHVGGPRIVGHWSNRTIIE